MLQELPVHHIGAHPPLHRCIRPIDELVRQAGPRVIAHGTKISTTTSPDVLRLLVPAEPGRCASRSVWPGQVTAAGRGIELAALDTHDDAARRAGNNCNGSARNARAGRRRRTLDQSDGTRLRTWSLPS